MAKEPKRDSIRVYDHIWAEPDVRAMTKPAQLAFIYLTAWSKAMQKDGHFPDLALGMCNVTADELAELLAAEFVVKTETGYFIPKYADWQITEAERQLRSDVARVNGSKGGETKRNNIVAANKAVIEGNIAADEEARLRELYGIWYGYKPTNKDGGRLQESMATFLEKFAEVRPDLEEFTQRVMWRLQEFELDRRDDKHRFLGTIGNFLKNGAWRDQEAPRQASEKAPEPGFES